MNFAKWQNIKNLLSATLDLPEDERDTFLALEPDEDIRFEVEKLLIANDKANGFIDKPFLIERGLAEDEETDGLIGKQINNYLILEKIGAGGMGAVYLAERLNSDFKQKVAVKVIKRGMDSEAILKRFTNERRILSSLKHPNIAQLIDGGITSEGLPFFVLEYVEGKPLNQFCKENNLSLEERLKIFRRICSAVIHAHKNLVIHRDLKPSNILVTKDRIPKLLDFGIAKLLVSDESETTAPMTTGKMFTPEYASPEQILGKTVTTSTDVYSLGVILYELLTQQRPYIVKGKSYDEVVKSVCETEPRKPSSTRENEFLTVENQQETLQVPKNKLRGDLDNIILKALRKEPFERYGSVHQFSEDIFKFLKGLPVLARPQTLGYRFGKYFKRHKVGVLAAALVLISLFAGVSVATWQSIVAKQERDRANARFEKLRETAKLLMTETRDSLDYIPGTIKLRESLSEKSVDLLDSFYDDNSTDTDYLQELADAYEKLGKTQLWEYRKISNAKSDIEKTVEIRRKIVNLEPENFLRKVELSKSLSSLTEVLYFQRDIRKLESVRDETEKLLREIAHKEPTNENFSNLAQHLMGFVGTYKEFEVIGETGKSLDEANAIFQRIIEKEQGKSLSPQAKTELAWNLICQGGIFKYLQNYDDSLNKFDQAAKLAESAYNTDNSPQLAFNYNGFSHRMLGEIYEHQGNYQKAYEMYKYSFDWVKLRENNDSQSKPNLVWAFSNSANRCALMLERLGRKKEANEIIIKPWKDYSAFLELETNASSVVYAQEPLKYLAKYYAESNQNEKASEIWEQRIERIQKFLNKNPDDIGLIIYQVNAENAIGDIYSAFDEKSDTFNTKDKKRLAKSKSHYQNASELLRKVKTHYDPTEAEKGKFKKIEEKINLLGNVKLL
jgi:serine/threonine protein kinase